MKLKTVLAVSAALALPAAINAQSCVMFGSATIDITGVDIYTSDGYDNGTTVFLFGLNKAEEGAGVPIPAALGGGEILIMIPWGDPVLDQADENGDCHLGLRFDPRFLEYLRCCVYVQVFSVNSPDWPNVPTSTPIRMSSVITLDFVGWNDPPVFPTWPESEEAPNRGDGDASGGETIK